MLQDRRHKMTEEVLQKGNLSEAVVFLERDFMNRADTISKESVRIRHMIVGILPCAKFTYLISDAQFGEKKVHVQAQKSWQTV